MIKLKYSECHPLESKVLNEQFLSKEEIVIKYKNFPWEELLKEHQNATYENIHFPPSTSVEDEDGKAIAVSIVSNPDRYEFYVCFKRPMARKRKKWLGLVEYDYYDKKYCSLIPKQTKEDGLEAFLLFYERNFKKLEEKW